MTARPTTVTKSNDMDVYRVRANGEWATICVQGWQVPADKFCPEPREIGEILIHSSFGSWAYQWGHLGLPFKQWLVKTNDRDYVAGKFLGTKAYEFDGQKTVAELRKSLIEYRRTGDLTKNDAATLWEYINDNESELEHSADSFCQVMGDAYERADWQDLMTQQKYPERGPGRGARHFLEEPWERTSTTLNRSFAAFWRDIWPVFQGALRTELQLTIPKKAE